MAKQKFTPQTPENYIKSGNARKLPVYECFINDDFLSAGMANVIVARKHKNGNLTGAFYLIDMLCLGVKDSLYFFNIDKEEYEGRIGASIENKLKIEYNYAHNLIFGADIYAEELGLSSHRSFKISQYILDEDTDDIDPIYFEFGDGGKPHLIVNPDENRDIEIRILEKTLGKDGFMLSYQDAGFDDDEFDDEFDDDEDEEEEEEDYTMKDETEKKINDNDFLFHIEFDDMPILEGLLIAYNNDIKEQTDSYTQNFINNLENIPDFIAHKTADDFYNNGTPRHQAAVDAIKIKLPGIIQGVDDIYNYPEDLETLEDDFNEIFDGFLENENNNDEAEKAALNEMKKKYKGREALCVFLIDHDLENSDDSNFTLYENYLEAFPDSLNARANYLTEMFYFLHESNKITANELLSNIPFEIIQSNEYSNQNGNISGAHIIEVLSWLFLQGIYHIKNKNIPNAEACLREMAGLRLKDHIHFSILRDLLTLVKTDTISEFDGNETELKQ